MFIVCFLSSAVRCQPLSRALCAFNEVKNERCN
ncbi:acetyltransferase [Vibrio anguillarum]|uniref:Acetyltransferase n=1 Tax=Vibrio anguillarum TaxID=55601 RepID=A0ABR9ZAW4_VIBAN|nr:acetyltransferase [Vibrio anguillarum]